MNSQLSAVYSNVLFSEFNMVLHIKGPVIALTAPDYVNDDDNDDHDEAHFYLFATVFVCTSLFCIHSFICIHLKISLLCHHLNSCPFCPLNSCVHHFNNAQICRRIKLYLVSSLKMILLFALTLNEKIITRILKMPK